MSRLALRNCLIYETGTRSFVKAGLVCENGIIVSHKELPDAADLQGAEIIPGLVDVHTHGRGGYDFISADGSALREMKRLYAATGVTTAVPTLASDTLPNMLDAVGRIREAGFTAVHIEGRYLNPKRRGAHKAELLAPLSPEEIGLFAEAAGEMKLHFTAAYELDKDGAFLAGLCRRGYTAGLGHSDASYEEAMTAVSRGLRSFTHTFNTMPPIHHRAGGAVLAALLSDAYAEFICDGFHLAPETLRLVRRIKAPDKTVLITDSMEGTGCPDGSYSIAGLPVILKDGKAYTVEGAIAGSTLDLLDGVKNFAAFAGIPFEEALPSASSVPAAMLGLPGVGSLAIGMKADLVILDENRNVGKVYVNGETL